MRQGIALKADNDSQAAAGYLIWRLSAGASVDEALEAAAMTQVPLVGTDWIPGRRA